MRESEVMKKLNLCKIQFLHKNQWTKYYQIDSIKFYITESSILMISKQQI